MTNKRGFVTAHKARYAVSTLCRVLWYLPRLVLWFPGQSTGEGSAASRSRRSGSGAAARDQDLLQSRQEMLRIKADPSGPGVRWRNRLRAAGGADHEGKQGVPTPEQAPEACDNGQQSQHEPFCEPSRSGFSLPNSECRLAGRYHLYRHG